MPDKLSINQRVRELIADLGYADNLEGFHKRYFGGQGRSEKLRNVWKDANLIKTDFLVEIADKIAQLDRKEVNLNWVLSGHGEKYITEDDRATKQLLIDTQRELLAQLRGKIADLQQKVDDLEDRLKAASANHHQ